MTNLHIESLQREIEQQRNILADPDKRHMWQAAEQTLGSLQRQLSSARRGERERTEREQEQARERRKQERAARRALENELMEKYIAAAPGTTRAEARKALPSLLDEHRRREMGAFERQVAEARRRGAYQV